MFLRTAAIIILGFIAYASMLPAPFRMMDDRLTIVDNPAIQSTKNISFIFQKGYFNDHSYYRPLIDFSFMMEYRIFGLNSFYYNLDNLILHILNALLVIMLVSKLTNKETIGFWTGLLFVIHPLQWEAVCNVQGRAILLGALFVLSSFILFLEYYKYRHQLSLILVMSTFFLGLLCKESVAVLPLVLVAFLSMDKSKPWNQKIKFLWPFFVGIIGYIVLRQYLGLTDDKQIGQSRDVIIYFITFLRSVITDLRLIILPIDLHFDRSLALFTSLYQPQALFTCLIWFFILIIFLFSYRKIHAFSLFLVLWFCIELIPISQLVASIVVGKGRISTAEHFLYLASIPIFIGMVTVYRWILIQGIIKKPILKFLAGGFLVFLLLTAVEQSIYSSNEFNMITRSLNFEPMNPRLQGVLGLLYASKNDIPDAQEHFRAAIKLEPNNPIYHIQLGTALCQQGQWIEGLEQLVAFDPGKEKTMVKAQEVLTMAHLKQQLNEGKSFDARGWLAMGIYDAQNGLRSQAIEAFQKTVSLNPAQADAWFNLGSLYEAGQDWSNARTAYNKLLVLDNLTTFQKDFAQQHLIIMKDR